MGGFGGKSRGVVSGENDTLGGSRDILLVSTA
jgi:hypothetical protein